MRRWFLSALLLLPLCAAAQHRADPQALSEPGGSSLILLGDPQGYEKYDINQGIFEICTAWIADHVAPLNIKAVLCTGDLVEQNDNNALDRRMLNQSSRQMWASVSRAFERLDGKVPYLTSPGNHDYGYKSSEDVHTCFPDWFTFERQGAALRDCLVSEFHNREGRASLENAAVLVTLPGWDKKLLLITLEFTPSDEALSWAKATAERFADCNVVVMTHSYLKCWGKCDNARYTEPENYGISRLPGNNYGEQIWEKLIRPTPNIRLVLCGHHGHTAPTEEERYATSTGWRVDRNDAGKEVGQMMFNVQTVGGGWEGNGGDGWIRILEFLPDGKTLRVRTYSPLFGISNLTKHLAHRTGPYDQFDFVIE